MSDVKKIVEKFSISILGENPQVIVGVLVSFTLVVLEKWRIPVDEFVEALRGGPTPTVRVPPERPPGAGRD